MLDISFADLPVPSVPRDTRNPKGCAECRRFDVRPHAAPGISKVFHIPSREFYKNGRIYTVMLLGGKKAWCNCPYGRGKAREYGQAEHWHVGSARRRRAIQLSEGRETYSAEPQREYVIIWQTPYELFSGDEMDEIEQPVPMEDLQDMANIAPYPEPEDTEQQYVQPVSEWQREREAFWASLLSSDEQEGRRSALKTPQQVQGPGYIRRRANLRLR